MNKRGYGKWTVMVMLLVTLVFGCNVGKITSRIIDHFYPERIFGLEEMQSQLQLKEIAVAEDGRLVALSNGPWIYLDFSVLDDERPMVVNLKVEECPDDYNICIYMINSLKLEERLLKKGDNYVLMDNLESTDVGVRFDIFTKTGQDMRISEIVVNDNVYMTSWLCRGLRNLAMIELGILLFYALCYGISIMRSKGDYSKYQKGICYGSLGLCGLGVVTGLWELLIIGFALYFALTQKNEREETVPKWKNWLLIFGVSVVMALFLPCIQSEQIWMLNHWEDKVILLFFAASVWVAAKRKYKAFGCILFYLWEHTYFLSVVTNDPMDYLAKYNLFNTVALLNLTLVLVLYLAIDGLLGKRLGGLINWLLLIIYFAANVIKLRFNGDFFRKNDFTLYKELGGIIGNYVPKSLLIVAVIALLGLLIWVITHYKSVGRYLKPQFKIEGVVFGAAFVMVAAGILTGKAAGAGIDMQNSEIKMNIDKEIENYGFAVFTLAEYTGSNSMEEPDEYGESIVQEMEGFRQQQDQTRQDQENPIVILILAESLYEIEQVPDLSFNMPILENLTPYKLVNGISPFYGGGTATAEFESLTGLPNMYFTNGAVAYTSYLNSRNNPTGGLAREFANNGYHTIAIHANREDFYSRNIVYENMGFEDFISKEDMDLTQDDLLNDGFVKDDVFVDYIIDTIETYQQEPLFIFGASISSHGLYDDKYIETEVQASSDTYSQAALDEVNNYAQAIHDLDVELGRLFAYCDELE